MRELFVYYRIRPGAEDEARAAVASMHDELRASHPGLFARLLVRSDEAGTATWMETYAMSFADVDARMESALVARAVRLAAFIDGPRHVEAFDRVA